MKRFISIALSAIILSVIYSKIDFPKLVQVFQNCYRWWMEISLGMVVPLTMLTAWRLQQLMPTVGRTDSSALGFAEANRLILVASVLNMVLPSKMGDIAKAYFMKERGHLSGSLSLWLVVFEKACDMLSLLLWCVFGLMLYPSKDWLFWVMTGSVVFGFVVGLSLLSSRDFAKLFFAIGKAIILRIRFAIAPKKLRSKLEKLHVSWSEMHDYFWRDKVQLLKITGTSVFTGFFLPTILASVW